MSVWRKKHPPAEPQPKLLTAADILNADKGITAYLSGISTLENIDPDELESLVHRGRAIVREWASKGLEQWAPNQK